MRERLEHVEAGQLGQVDIEEYEIGFARIDQFDGGESVSRLAGDLDPVGLGQHVAERFAREWFVFDDDDGAFHVASSSASLVSAGNVSVARKPLPGDVSTMSEASVPCRTRSRSRTT